jgi:hypothetical protein
VDVVPRRLISMVICSGKVIDSLTFIYNDRDEQQHTAGPWGGLGMSRRHRDGQQQEFHTVSISPELYSLFI